MVGRGVRVAGFDGIRRRAAFYRRFAMATRHLSDNSGAPAIVVCGLRPVLDASGLERGSCGSAPQVAMDFLADCHHLHVFRDFAGTLARSLGWNHRILRPPDVIDAASDVRGPRALGNIPKGRTYLYRPVSG